MQILFSAQTSIRSRVNEEHITMTTMPQTEEPVATENDRACDFPYGCDIDVAFPTSEHAVKTMQVMQVDTEISDKVLKEFSLHGEEQNILRM